MQIELKAPMHSPTSLFSTLVTVIILCVPAISEYKHYSTSEIYTNPLDEEITYYRPPWSGNVTIIYDHEQIWHVFGVVIPCSTTGRPSAPYPYNGHITGRRVRLDKGHLMALSNGGPDIRRNIVPQSDKWQEHGGWRKLETAIHLHAVQEYGWNPKAVPKCTIVHDKPDPGQHAYVTFNVSAFDYDPVTGQPGRYTGTVHSVNNTVYSFSITPEEEAIWSNGLIPPHPPRIWTFRNWSRSRSSSNTNWQMDSPLAGFKRKRDADSSIALPINQSPMHIPYPNGVDPFKDIMMARGPEPEVDNAALQRQINKEESHLSRKRRRISRRNEALQRMINEEETLKSPSKRSIEREDGNSPKKKHRSPSPVMDEERPISGLSDGIIDSGLTDDAEPLPYPQVPSPQLKPQTVAAVERYRYFCPEHQLNQISSFTAESPEKIYCDKLAITAGLAIAIEQGFLAEQRAAMVGEQQQLSPNSKEAAGSPSNIDAAPISEVTSPNTESYFSRFRRFIQMQWNQRLYGQT